MSEIKKRDRMIKEGTIGVLIGCAFVIGIVLLGVELKSLKEAIGFALVAATTILGFMKLFSL